MGVAFRFREVWICEPRYHITGLRTHFHGSSRWTPACQRCILGEQRIGIEERDALTQERLGALRGADGLLNATPERIRQRLEKVEAVSRLAPCSWSS